MSRPKPIRDLTLHGIKIRFNRLQGDITCFEENEEFKRLCKLLRKEIIRIGLAYGQRKTGEVLDRARDLLFSLDIEVRIIKNRRKMDML